MKLCFLLSVVILIYSSCESQELFVFSEPASNMPKGNLGLRWMNSTMKKINESANVSHSMPELMYGINNKWMIHTTAFMSNLNKPLDFEGASFYLKHKFINQDDIKKHFRMAGFGRYSFNKSKIHQEEINLIGHNTGYELGINATKLANRVAISFSVSYMKAINNGQKTLFPKFTTDKAIYSTLSVGKLILPKKYIDYRQTNINLMCEFLSQNLINDDKKYLDIAPSIQFIFLSKIRLDLAYRKQLYSNMVRTAPNGFFIRLEYNFYNIY
jgi:hypothetical protein